MRIKRRDTQEIIKIDGRSISFYRSGKGYPLVLLPGFGARREVWKEIIPALSKYFKVYAFSLPVWGTYNNKGKQYHLKNLGCLFEKLIKNFKIKKPVIVGHSIGSVIALKYALRHPKSVKKLIFVSSPLTDHRRKIPFSWRIAVKFALKSKRTANIIGYLCRHPRLMRTISRIVLPKKIIKISLSEPAIFFRDFPVKALASCYAYLFKASFKNDLLKINTPVLFIYGTKDKTLRRFGGTTLYSSVSGAKIFPLPCSHFIPTELPEELSHLILEFTGKKPVK